MSVLSDRWLTGGIVAQGVTSNLQGRRVGRDAPRPSTRTGVSGTGPISRGPVIGVETFAQRMSTGW